MISENSRLRWMKQFEMGVGLNFTPKEIQDDKDLVLYAVARNGLNLEFASERLKGDINVNKKAASQNFEALEFASKDLQYLIVSNLKRLLQDEENLDLDVILEKTEDEISNTKSRVK